MPAYNYKARDASGKSVGGTMDAPTKAELIDKLQKMGYMTTSVFEVTSGGMNLEAILDRFKWIKSDEMLMFYIQLSNMLSSGINILMSLSILSGQIGNKKLKAAVESVSRQVEGGSSLSKAFAAYPQIFPRLFINMIKAGEASGNLDKVLLRYAGFFESQEDLKQKVQGALFYPLILLCAGTAVTLLIVTFVIPQFADIYIKASVKLPTPTQIVYNIGLIIKHYWYALIAVVIIILVGLKYYFSTQKGGFVLDTLMIRLPIIGPLLRKVAISRFTRTLSTLLGSGVPILESLDITREVIGNEVLARVIDSVREYVEKGERMAEPMKVSGEFPPDVVQMMSVGEETGNIEGMLSKIADFYDMTVNYAVKKLTTIIEPLFLVILGCMVGTIMASMLLPIFDMVKTLKH